MRHKLALAMTLAIGVLLGFSPNGQGQDTDSAPEGVNQGPQDAGLVMKVHEVYGSVKISKIGTDPKMSSEWRPLRAGEEVHANEQIRTGFRGRAKLYAQPATPPTVVMVQGGSLISFEELALRGGVSRSRIGLRYGAIRAGVAEGQVRSDMEISCPVATLSKRGTDIFELSYLKGQFRMSLSPMGRGMLRAFQFQYGSRGNLTRTRSRFITPGQFITKNILQAIDSVQMDRSINISDPFGMQGSELLFQLLNDGGLSVLFAQGTDLSSIVAPSEAGQQAPDTQTLQPLGATPGRREGDFGIGGGLIPGVLDAFLKGRIQENRQTNCKGAEHSVCPTQTMRRLGRRR